MLVLWPIEWSWPFYINLYSRALLVYILSCNYHRSDVSRSVYNTGIQSQPKYNPVQHSKADAVDKKWYIVQLCVWWTRDSREDDLFLSFFFIIYLEVNEHAAHQMVTVTISPKRLNPTYWFSFRLPMIIKTKTEMSHECSPVFGRILYSV